MSCPFCGSARVYHPCINGQPGDECKCGECGKVWPFKFIEVASLSSSAAGTPAQSLGEEAAPVQVSTFAPQGASQGVSSGTEGRAIALGVSKPVRTQSVRASSEYQASPADSKGLPPETSSLAGVEVPMRDEPRVVASGKRPAEEQLSYPDTTATGWPREERRTSQTIRGKRLLRTGSLEIRLLTANRLWLYGSVAIF